MKVSLRTELTARMRPSLSNQGPVPSARPPFMEMYA
jgi:hypothetical protein